MIELWERLAPVIGLGQLSLMTAFIVFLRVGAAMALLPALGEQTIPARVRLALALAITGVVAPLVADGLAPLASRGEVIAPFILTETVIGLSIGIMLRLFVLALQTAGAIVAQSISLSQLFGGAAPEPQPVVSNLLIVAGLALAVTLGMHLRMVALIALSYDLFPAGQLPFAGDMSAWALGTVGRTFALSFSLAAPFVIASLLYNALLGAINRAMPSLMVSMVGAPAQTLGGMVLLLLLIPAMLAIWYRAFDSFLLMPLGTTP